MIIALNDVIRFIITIILWKANQNVSHMVITCLYVDSNQDLQKHIISFCDVPPQTAIIIFDALNKCLVEWGLEKKVWIVTIDNATYNDASMRKDNTSYHNSLPFGGKLFHVRCCAHILNLFVIDELSEIKDIIKNVCGSVKLLMLQVLY